MPQFIKFFFATAARINGFFWSMARFVIPETVKQEPVRIQAIPPVKEDDDAATAREKEEQRIIKDARLAKELQEEEYREFEKETEDARLAKKFQEEEYREFEKEKEDARLAKEIQEKQKKLEEEQAFLRLINETLALDKQEEVSKHQPVASQAYCMHSAFDTAMLLELKDIYKECIQNRENYEREVITIVQHQMSSVCNPKNAEEGKSYRIHPDAIGFNQDNGIGSYSAYEKSEIAGLKKNLEEAKGSKACLGVTLYTGTHFTPIVIDLSGHQPVVYSFESVYHGAEGPMISEKEIRDVMKDLGYNHTQFTFVPQQLMMQNKSYDTTYDDANGCGRYAVSFHDHMAGLSEEKMKKVLTNGHKKGCNPTGQDWEYFTGPKQTARHLELFEAWESRMPSPSMQPSPAGISGVGSGIIPFSCYS